MVDRLVLHGNRYRYKDDQGNYVYSARWFQGHPDIFEIVDQDYPTPPNSPGYNIPLETQSPEWKRLWWALTDHESPYTPKWTRVDVPTFVAWLEKMGFTGRSEHDWEERQMVRVKKYEPPSIFSFRKKRY